MAPRGFPALDVVSDGKRNNKPKRVLRSKVPRYVKFLDFTSMMSSSSAIAEVKFRMVAARVSKEPEARAWSRDLAG